MKRLIGSGVIIFIFFISFSLVSAITCANPNDVILKLSGTTNAHGATFSELLPIYTNNEICYSTLFGQAAPAATPAINRACTTGNSVVRLSANTNAHGELPGQTTSTYFDVCYPGLTCSTISSGSCASGTTAVLSLSSQTDAHLGVGGSYSNKVCCSLSTSPPTGSGITSPIHRGIYFTGVPITFRGGCSTTQGTPTYIWSVKQSGSTVPGLPSAPQPDMFVYQFGSAGQVDVQLTCSYPSAPSVKSEIGMLVVASPGTFAYIDKPAFEAIVTHPAGYAYQTEVNFAAKDSFVVDVNTCNVNCLGGYCRQTTENSPTTCNPGNGPLVVNTAPSSQAAAVWSGINFDWTFSGDNGWIYDGQGTSTTPNLDGLPEGFAYYNSKSNAINDKHIDVTVDYTSTGVASTFRRDFTLGNCLNNGNTFLDPNGAQYPTSSQTGNYCKGLDQVSTADDCCPAGHACLAGTSGNYYCQIPTTPLPDECSDFITQSDCIGNTDPTIPLNSLDPSVVLTQCQVANCAWDNTAHTCDVQISQFSSSSTGQCGTTTPTAVCQYSITQSSCNGGSKTIHYTLDIPPSTTSCPTKSDITVPCGDLNFELGFFDYWQFFASAAIIGLVYLALGTRKNEK